MVVVVVVASAVTLATIVVVATGVSNFNLFGWFLLCRKNIIRLRYLAGFVVSHIYDSTIHVNISILTSQLHISPLYGQPQIFIQMIVLKTLYIVH